MGAERHGYHSPSGESAEVKPLRDLRALPGHTVNGLHLYSAFLTSGHSTCLTILPDAHPFMRSFTRRRWCQPSNATARSSRAVRVSCRAQGHLDIDQISSLPAGGQAALPPEPHASAVALTSWRAIITTSFSMHFFSIQKCSSPSFTSVLLICLLSLFCSANTNILTTAFPGGEAEPNVLKNVKVACFYSLPKPPL